MHQRAPTKGDDDATVDSSGHGVAAGGRFLSRDRGSGLAGQGGGRERGEGDGQETEAYSHRFKWAGTAPAVKACANPGTHGTTSAVGTEITFKGALMRATLVLGILLILAGGYILVQGLSVTTNREVIDLGPLQASVSEKKMVPTWVGGVGVAAGLVLIIAGAGAGKKLRA